MRRPEYKEKYGPVYKFKKFEELIARLRKVNPEAADLLADMGSHGLNPVSFGYCGELEECLMWRRSPEGFNYWYAIEKLMEAYYETCD